MSEETGEPKTSSSSKKPSATKGDGKKTLIAWANQKNNLGSAVTAEMTESVSMSKGIAKALRPPASKKLIKSSKSSPLPS